MAQGDLLLRITGMIKDFPGNRALDDVSLDVHSGEIVAVVGHNGSGKSTLVKILAGVYTKDAGEVEFPSSTPEEPTELHIIHQDLGLAMPFNAIENLGIPKDKGFAAGFSPFNKKKEREQALQLINRFGEPFDVTVPVGTLAPAQRSIIGIARALDGWHHPRNILILDEPTEALHASEVEVLFEAVKTLAAEGAGIIFISHRLDEVLGLADRVVVLRDGKKVADDPRAAIDHDKLVSYVTGVAAGEAEHGRTDRKVDGPVVLEIENLQGADIEDIDFTLRAGEVVGVAGVLGSGREALPALIFGSLPSQATKFEVAGQAYDKRSPRESIRRGLGFVPGDRAKLGSVRPMTARENMTLPNMKGVTSGGALSKRKERAAVQDLVVKYDVKPPRQEQVFSLFSGGNQQKIVFAKWLRNEPKVLLLEEPTQGVDIGAKQALYNAIDAAAASGAGVLVCSSEAKELVRLCDRVLVMRGGKVAADLTGEDLTETRIVLEGYGFGNEEEQ